MLRQGKLKPGWHPIEGLRRARLMHLRRVRLLECLELFLRKSPAGYGVRFDNPRAQTEFAYTWEAIICKN
jgi:hypothetical protein